MGVADIIQLLISIAQGNVEKEHRLPVGPVMDHDTVYCAGIAVSGASSLFQNLKKVWLQV